MGQNDRAQSAREDKKVAAAAAKKAVADWRGYINVTLTEAQKAELADWQAGGLPWVTLDDAARSGCVVSVKFEDGRGNFLASVTQRNAASVNAGLCITARGREAGIALMRVLFLLSHVGVLNDWAEAHPVAGDDIW